MRASVSERTLQQAAAELGIECRANEPLGPHTTMGVGGPAPFLLLPRDAAGLAGSSASSRIGHALPVSGAGSNVIVADEGVATPVISCARWPRRSSARGIPCAPGAGVLRSASGPRDGAHGPVGPRVRRGIPGSVGGCVRMNAGAGGRWIGDSCARSSS
jgi:UDP-N-acetylmuramate dehydrogenase